MTTTLEQANDSLREAVRARLGATPKDDPKMKGYTSQPATEPRDIGASTEDLQQENDEYSEWVPPSYAVGQTLPAEQLLLDALAVIRDRRPKYGGPLQHFRRTVGMINAAFADVLRRPLTEADWAIFMTLDKVARYCGPNKTADGPVDLAGYAACLAEVEAARHQ
jgi:hypothetical protein